MNICWAAIAHNVKLNKRAMRRIDARINLVRQPVLLHLAPYAINVPAIFAAECRILDAEAALGVWRGKVPIRPSYRPAFAIRHRRIYWRGHRTRHGMSRWHRLLYLLGLGSYFSFNRNAVFRLHWFRLRYGLSDAFVFCGNNIIGGLLRLWDWDSCAHQLGFHGRAAIIAPIIAVLCDCNTQPIARPPTTSATWNT